MSWLRDALIASALLMVAVLVLRGPVRRAFGPRVAYALWALPALRLVLPPLPAGWWHAATVAPVTRAGELVILLIEPAARPSGPSLGPVALAWASGALALIGVHLIRHRRFCARILREAQPIGREGGIEIVASPAAPGPVAFGLWRRIVAVPADFETHWDADERALALAHELGHHARRDLHANWAALVVLAVHWWNPLAWHALRAFRADQELANDARVLATCRGSVRHAYGRAIVKTASLPAPALSAACHFHTISDLKRRLRMLTTSPFSRRRLATGAAAVSLLMAGGLGLTASAGAAAARIGDTVDAALQPLAPPAPATPTERGHVRRVTVVKDGKSTSFEGAAADAYAREHGLPVPPAPPAGDPRQARTVVARPDGKGSTVLIVRRASVVPGAPLPPDVRLPRDFAVPTRCANGEGAPAQVIKGQDGDQTYTILCTRAAGAGEAGADTEGAAYRQALASLTQARASIATQPASAMFGERDRRDALASVDHSIDELKADLAALR